MRWAACGYGAALGAAQFFVLRAILIRALRAQGRLSLSGPLALGLAAYLAAALAAIYLFTQQLVWVAVGLGVGLLGAAALWLARAVWRASRAPDEKKS